MTLKKLQKLAGRQNFCIIYNPSWGGIPARLSLSPCGVNMNMGDSWYGTKKKMIKIAVKWLKSNAKS